MVLVRQQPALPGRQRQLLNGLIQRPVPPQLRADAVTQLLQVAALSRGCPRSSPAPRARATLGLFAALHWLSLVGAAPFTVMLPLTVKVRTASTWLLRSAATTSAGCAR